MIFCDTSTLAKYYVPEPETAAVQSILDAADRVLLSELARTELMAVFHRRLREGKWSRGEFLAATRQLNHDDVAGLWTWVALDSAIAREAANAFVTLPETVFLRAADCLHLITALRHGFSDIHTHDHRQAAGASALGLRGIVID